jgi:hypothetical protein
MKKLILILLSPLFASAQTEQGYDKKFVRLHASYPELLAFVKEIKTKDIHGNFYIQKGLKTKYGQDGTYILNTGRSENHHFITTTYHYFIKNDTVFLMEVIPNKGKIIELR